jgi:hypothetical protein
VFPNSVGAVLGFLLVVAPGLIFEAIREHRRPSAERSAFREVSAVALASLVCGVIALAVMWGVKSARPSLLPDAQLWLLKGNRYFADHVPAVLTFFGGWILVASLAAYLGAWLLPVKFEAHIDTHTTGWFEVFRKQKPSGRVPIALVKLDDQSEYVGEVMYYDPNMVTVQGEIVLGPPLWSVAVWVRYPPGARPTDKKKTWWQAFTHWIGSGSGQESNG